MGGDEPDTIITPEITNEEDTVSSVSLNGAQIAGLLAIVQSVIDGVLDYESAVVLIVSAFPFDEETARKILGDKEKIDKKASEKAIAEEVNEIEQK